MEREKTTVLVGGVTSRAFDTCPLCGHQLGPAQAAQAITRLQQEPDSKETRPG